MKKNHGMCPDFSLCLWQEIRQEMDFELVTAEEAALLDMTGSSYQGGNLNLGDSLCRKHLYAKSTNQEFSSCLSA